MPQARPLRKKLPAFVVLSRASNLEIVPPQKTKSRSLSPHQMIGRWLPLLAEW